jgi:hypothetical protein
VPAITLEDRYHEEGLAMMDVMIKASLMHPPTKRMNTAERRRRPFDFMVEYLAKARNNRMPSTRKREWPSSFSIHSSSLFEYGCEDCYDDRMAHLNGTYKKRRSCQRKDLT